MKIQKTKFLNIKFKFVYSTFCCVLEFKTFEFRLRFFFSIVRYMSSVLIFFFFLIFYFFDLKFYSLFKTYLLEYITIEMYNFSLKIFWFIILMLILIFIIIKYRSGTKAEFIRFFIVLFYHRLNFLINFIILLVILPITPYEFFEYNFLIILLFSFFSIYRIIGKFFKKREQKKLIKNKSISFTLIHYLSWPWISVIFWIIFYLNICNTHEFIYLFSKFWNYGFDMKFYDIDGHFCVNPK